jgi:hypothetical protein
LHTLRLGATKITDAGLLHLRGLNRLEELDLNNTKVSGAGFRDLEGLHLKRLDLYGSLTNDAGLSFLGGQANLKVLDLAGTKISGAGLIHLAQLKQLEVLNIDGEQLVDDDVERLRAWPNLRTLCLRQTGLSASAVNKLRLGLPGCHMEF